MDDKNPTQPTEEEKIDEPLETPTQEAPFAEEVLEDPAEPATAEPQEVAETETKHEAEETAQPEAVDEATEEVEGENEKDESSNEEPPLQEDPSGARWYIVHTYSGHENKVAKSIKQRVQSLGFENRIFDIIVPTRNTIKVSQGKKETVKEKIFPGYVLIKMKLDDESWLLIRTTQGVTAFIGAGNKPTPISQKEVEAIQKFMDAEEPLYKTSFTIGEAVKIVDGPFSDFLGTIDDIDEAKGKLKVLVSIFGRETPVELDFLQVNKL